MKYTKHILPLTGLLLAALGLQPSTCPAQTAPRITLFQKTGQLTWTNVIPGHYYAVQAKPSASQTWTNLSGGLDNIQASGTTMTVTVPVGASTMFYTVVDRGSCCLNNGGTTLANAAVLGSVCGDTGGATYAINGCGNAWYRIHVNECDSNILNPVNLRLRTTLQPPSGTDYDLYVYRPDATLLGSSTNGIGVPDSLLITQADNPSGNDSFDVIIEVRRHLAYPCSTWSLTVQGNVP